MKALAWIFVLLVGLACDGPHDALATAGGPDYYAVAGVAAGNVLNIRAEPSANAAKVGEIPHDGRGLQNLGCTGGPTFAQWQEMSETEREQARRQRWCRIRYGGVEGWVAGWFLTEDSGPPARPEETSR